MRRGRAAVVLAGAVAALLPAAVLAHNVAAADRAFLQAGGFHPAAYAYLGAKHMLTGYDHLLFLFGVVFFLQRLRDVAVYVTLFAAGHSLTLLAGVLAGWRVDPYAIDAIIGLSVAYKAFENLGGFRRLVGWQPDAQLAVAVFGLFHGLGLATRLEQLALARGSLVANLVSFNAGVEIGQLLALTLIVLALDYARTRAGFERRAFAVNVVLMTLGFLLVGYQLGGFFLGGRQA